MHSAVLLGATAAAHACAFGAEIIRYYSLGNLATAIQGLLPAYPPPPPLGYIQQVIDEERRRTRAGLPPYEAVHLMCRDLLAEQHRVILYLVPDPDLDPADFTGGLGVPVGALHIVVCSTPEMIESVRTAQALGADTKWRTREGGGCVQGILAFSQQSQPKPTEGHRTEFDAGYRGHKATVVTVALANLDNYWTLKVQLDAIRGMLPCDDPQCSHPIVRVDLDNRGSFVLQRACRKHPQRRVWWSGFGPLQRFPTGMVGMIDKAAYEARALRKCGLRVFLCSFHVYAAVLEKFDKDLRIRHGPTLFALIIGLKWLARSRTQAELGKRWAVVRSKSLPQLALGAELTAKIASYVESEWLCETWAACWTDIGRTSSDPALDMILRHMVTTNNATERFWIRYQDVACNHKMFSECSPSTFTSLQSV